MTVGVLLLAAGRSTRFGSDKRLARLPDGQQLIDLTLNNIRDSGLACCVSIDKDDLELVDRFEQGDITLIRCTRAGEGMGSTLAESMLELPDWEGVMIALADMPWIASHTYRRVADQLTQDTICLPVFDGLRGHPVGFGRSFWTQLSNLSGDSGARCIVERNTDSMVEVQVSDRGILLDIDRPSDLTAATASNQPLS